MNVAAMLWSDDVTMWANILWQQTEPTLSLDQIASELGTSLRSLLAKARHSDFPERDGFRSTPPPLRLVHRAEPPALVVSRWTAHGAPLPLGPLSPALTCQWPLWTDTPGVLGAHPFCDAASEAGSSYCPTHHARTHARQSRTSRATQEETP